MIQSASSRKPASKPDSEPGSEIRAASEAMGVPQARWILLIHSIPPRPNYLRVKIGRRLQKVGAIAVKSSVYVLPGSDGAREDLEWIAHEIVSDGGEASLCESRFIGGLTDETIEQQFRFARQRDYLELVKEARRLVDGLSRAERLPAKRRPQAETGPQRIRRRGDEALALDLFGA